MHQFLIILALLHAYCFCDLRLSGASAFRSTDTCSHGHSRALITEPEGVDGSNEAQSYPSAPVAAAAGSAPPKRTKTAEDVKKKEAKEDHKHKKKISDSNGEKRKESKDHRRKKKASDRNDEEKSESKDHRHKKKRSDSNDEKKESEYYKLKKKASDSNDEEKKESEGYKLKEKASDSNDEDTRESEYYTLKKKGSDSNDEEKKQSKDNDEEKVDEDDKTEAGDKDDEEKIESKDDDAEKVGKDGKTEAGDKDDEEKIESKDDDEEKVGEDGKTEAGDKDDEEKKESKDDDEKVGEDDKTEASDKDDEEKEEEEKEEEDTMETAVLYSRREIMKIQAGWLGYFAAVCIAVYMYMHLVGLVTPPLLEDVKTTYNEEIGGTVAKCYDLCWGNGIAAKAIMWITIALSLLNFTTYSILTESDIPDHDGPVESPFAAVLLGGDPFTVNLAVETVSAVLLGVLFLVRIVGSVGHPSWRSYPVWATPFRYFFGNICTVLEFIALIVAAVSIPDCYSNWGKCSHWNCMFFFFARTVEWQDTEGKIRVFDKVMKDGWLLFTSACVGLVVWLLLSALYFLANRSNTDGDDSVREAVKYVGADGNMTHMPRFESIPSNMFYVLVNLVGEHPLADAYITFWQRLLVVIVCLFAAPVFALPIGIMESSIIGDDEEENGDGSAPRDEDASEIYAGWEWWGRVVVTGFTAFLSVYAYFLFTARQTKHSFLFGQHVDVSETLYAHIDGMAAIIFFVDHVSVVLREGAAAQISTMGFIDFLAWVPGVAHGVMWHKGMEIPPALLAVVVTRMIKLERYFHGFRDVVHVFAKNKNLLIATFLMSSFIWAFFTWVLYLTERDNPDQDDMEPAYGSMLRSGYSEILQLHGEFPWINYSAAGKTVSTIIALVGILIACVPIAIFVNSMSDSLAEIADGEEFDKRPWEARCRPEGGFRQSIYDLLYAHLHPNIHSPPPAVFYAFRALVFANVLMNNAVAILDSVDQSYWRDSHELVYDVLFHLDIVSTVIFSVEFGLRILAVTWRHQLSTVGICDMASLYGQALALRFKLKHEVIDLDSKNVLEAFTIPLRLLRIFCLDSYIGAFTMLKNIFYINRWPLLRSGFAMVCTWFCHCALLYLSENDNDGECKKFLVPEGAGSLMQRSALLTRARRMHGSSWRLARRMTVGNSTEEGEEDMLMCQRYDSMLRTLQYSIIHLSGDFPETDYTFPAKVVHVISVILGIAIISTFTGMISGAIVTYLDDERSKAMVELKVKQALSLARLAKRMQRQFRSIKAGSIQCKRDASARLSGFKRMARDIVLQNCSPARYIMRVFNVCLVVDITCTLVKTMPETRSYPVLVEAFNKTKNACLMVFIFEYIVRVHGSSKSLKDAILTPWRIIDLMCIFPGLWRVLAGGRFSSAATGYHTTFECVREAMVMFRSVRILNFPCFQKEIHMINKAVVDVIPMLTVPMFLAYGIWIFTSSLFVILEHRYEKDEGYGMAESMPDIPSAMYYCSIFLLGEWANCDFTYETSRLVIAYVVIGIAIFAIPVGLIVESMNNAIVVAAQESMSVAGITNMALSPNAITGAPSKANDRSSAVAGPPSNAD